MQDFPLTIQHVLWRIERLFAPKQIITREENGLHRYSWQECARRVHRLARALQRLGVKPGDRVATLAWNNYRHLELYYAIPCMGAVLHTLNLRLSPQQLDFVVADGGARVLVVDACLKPLLRGMHLKGVEHVVVADDIDYETLLAAESDEPFPWPHIEENMASAICHTSGTTGNPKGVVYSHRSTFLHSMTVLQADVLGLCEADVAMPLVPMFHVNCWGLPYACGMAGSTLILADRWMGDVSAAVELASAEGATVMAGVPTVWNNVAVLMESTGQRLPSLRTILCGGSAVPQPLLERLDALGLPLVHAWGMTETSPVATMAHPRSWQGNDMASRVAQGTPVVGMEFRIRETDTQVELPWDGVAFGELEVRGPWVCGGYQNGADPDRQTPDGWFRTGDVASIRPDGCVIIVDRIKDVIKSGGEWISSLELESTILAHPDIVDVAVVAVPHPKWMERPVAYVVARPGSELTQADVRDFLKDRILAWWMPDEIRFIDVLPRTSVGKLDKKALRAQAAPL